MKWTVKFILAFQEWIWSEWVTRKNAPWGPPAVVGKVQALISNDPGQSLRKLASIVDVSEPTMSNCRGRPSIQITLKIWQKLSEAAKTSRVVSVLILASQQPRLNLLDYYVWSVVENVTNKSPNMTSLMTAIGAAFVGTAWTALHCSMRMNASDRD